MINVVTFKGNLGANAKIHWFADGSGVANFSVAITKTFLDKDKKPQERTTWAPCKIFGTKGRIDFAEKYLKKGQSVVVTGELDMDKWTDKEQKEQSHLFIRCIQLELAGSKMASNDKSNGDDAEDSPAHDPNPSNSDFDPSAWNDEEGF